MKRLLTALTSLLCVIGLLGCNDGNRLTLDKVVELSAKGEDLTWSDFERYESKDVGSGLSSAYNITINGDFARA